MKREKRHKEQQKKMSLLLKELTVRIHKAEIMSRWNVGTVKG